MTSSLVVRVSALQENVSLYMRIQQSRGPTDVCKPAF